MYNDITGIILAGGKSSRMGVNKALLPLNGNPIIEHIASLLKSLFPSVILITNKPEDYLFLGLETFLDIYPGRGPLAGIHSGLIHSKTERNFVISCDVPLINEELIEYIVKYKTIYPITLLKAEGFIQHLCGMYNKSLKLTAEKILTDMETVEFTREKPKCNMTELLNIAGAEIIDSSKVPCYSDGLFLNVNVPLDYQTLLEKS